MTRDRPSPEEQIAERVRLARRRAAQVAHVEASPPRVIPAQRRAPHLPSPRVPFVMPPGQGAPHRHIAPQRHPLDMAGRPAPRPDTRPLPIGYDVGESARRRRTRVLVSVAVIFVCGALSIAAVLVFGVLMLGPA